MSTRTLHQIQQEGLDVLFEKLGPDDAIRFLQIYEPGSGDWTKDRKNTSTKIPIKFSNASLNTERKYQLHVLTLIFSRES